MGAFLKLPLLGNRFRVLGVRKPGLCPANRSRAQDKGVLPPVHPRPSDGERPGRPSEDRKGVESVRWIPSKRLFQEAGLTQRLHVAKGSEKEGLLGLGDIWLLL